MINLKLVPTDYIDLYLFGSAVYSENPTDIDVAIIYEEGKLSVDELVKYRYDLEKTLSEMTGCSVDTILLSTEEEKEMEFLSNAKCRKI